MAQALSNALREGFLSAAFHNTALSLSTTRWISFHTGDPGDIGSNEVTASTWTNYVRTSVDASTSGWSTSADTGAGEFLDNLNAISFGTATVSPATGQPQIQGVGIWTSSASTAAADFLYGDWLLTNRVAFTGLATNDNIYSPAHGFSTGQWVAFVGSALPTGLSEGTEYWVNATSSNLFQVTATSSGGTALNLTADGAGEVGVSQFIDVTNGAAVQISSGDLDIVMA